ncbi:GDP-L-fucose synthase [Candidatus Woesearchaeota archaeon]|nr:GDP-L-fucose synthase [Candidatus Woesearchaeota archaeon]
MPDINLRNKKILLTGGKGFVGKFVHKKLMEHGASEANIIVPSSKADDLREKEACRRVVKDKDIVIHLAAKVGGIGLNQEIPGELFYNNIIMGVQLMEEARKANVEKFVAIGTVCAYPKIIDIPFKEEDLWNGYPEETNAAYGLAKKMFLVQSQAYRKQYGFNSIFLLPANMYGPFDNLDLRTSHVIPAIIRKVFDAKNNGKDLVVWGTGNPTREFLYVEDAAEGIVLAAIRYDKSDPVNLGTGREISIKNLVQLIARLADFKGSIIWDNTKPDGQPRRCLNVDKARKEFDFQASTSLEEGLKKTIEWYKINYKKDNL